MLKSGIKNINVITSKVYTILLILALTVGGGFLAGWYNLPETSKIAVGYLLMVYALAKLVQSLK